jgi:hypothetical protein
MKRKAKGRALVLNCSFSKFFRKKNGKAKIFDSKRDRKLSGKKCSKNGMKKWNDRMGRYRFFGEK